jgi:hypothetical protein
MRLTVGPLPPAVYWRRRAVVLVGLAVVTLIVAYACGGSSSDANPGAAGGHQSPTQTSTLLHPTIGRSPTPTRTPTPTAFTLPQTQETGSCADDEIGLTALANPASVIRGGSVAFTITIKNISNRRCSRDIGAAPQELILYDASGTTVIWSSDDCSTDHSQDVQTLAPGQTRAFTLTWDGRRSRSGAGTTTCGDATVADPADYQLVARLGQKKSEPFILHITA